MPHRPLSVPCDGLRAAWLWAAGAPGGGGFGMRGFGRRGFQASRLWVAGLRAAGCFGWRGSERLQRRQGGSGRWSAPSFAESPPLHPPTSRLQHRLHLPWSSARIKWWTWWLHAEQRGPPGNTPPWLPARWVHRLLPFSVPCGGLRAAPTLPCTTPCRSVATSMALLHHLHPQEQTRGHGEVFAGKYIWGGETRASSRTHGAIWVWIAYVRQDDLFFSQLTVREMLSLATELQLPDTFAPDTFAVI
ncbi:hypothetical protein GUJ93_ZPchr0013g37242 [Zizania palustris]|uniref:Uncharacterized protein n=1 Tax=Zizania palustris TaxID=103762 RepID=A0A8J5X299_ZIZPA|nr:hypothetical protein GUJ93_ZPchr0013g37242 [Zizania palustris]